MRTASLAAARARVGQRMELFRNDAVVRILRPAGTPVYDAVTKRSTAQPAVTRYEGPAHIHPTSTSVVDGGGGEIVVRNLPVSLDQDLTPDQRPRRDDELFVVSCTSAPILVGRTFHIGEIDSPGLIGGVIRVTLDGPTDSGQRS